MQEVNEMTQEEKELAATPGDLLSSIPGSTDWEKLIPKCFLSKAHCEDTHTHLCTCMCTCTHADTYTQTFTHTYT